MIEPQENESRQNADREFLQSLNQLESLLNQPETKANKKSESQPNPANQTSEDNTADNNTGDNIDWDAWEDAVADIEQFLEKHNTDGE